jgi:hypothetical protein
MTETLGEPQPRVSCARRALRVAAKCALGLVALMMTGWAALAITFGDLSGAEPRYILAAMFIIASVLVVALIKPRRYGLAAFGVLFAIVFIWYMLLKPSNDRDWSPNVAQVPWAEINGNRLIVHNVRNTDYRSETDYTPAWSDQTYDLSTLNAVDYILSYWGGKAVAHGIVSFGFADGRHLAISIETRKERNESYSAVQGFFRQYELIYVFAEERDVLRLRTNYTHEHVYLYRTRMNPADGRAALLSYIEQANKLKDRPEFYNALTSNCITGIIPHARAGQRQAGISWEVLLSGYSARQAYRNGNLDDSIPFAELESRSLIDAAAIAADQDPGFSAKIRVGVPKPTTAPMTSASSGQ